MTKNGLIIFTRNPELGKVKTRLAKGVGEANALEIYKTLLNHTRDVALQVDCKRLLGYSVAISDNDAWDSSDFEKFEQQGDDLGLRMRHAFAKAFSLGLEKVVIVGSDLYDLRPRHIKAAFTALGRNDAVIGPAADGGYYLLGMKQLLPAVFSNKDWGTSSVYEMTMQDLNQYKVEQLEMLNDIDHVEDLAGYAHFARYITT